MPTTNEPIKAPRSAYTEITGEYRMQRKCGRTLPRLQRTTSQTRVVAGGRKYRNDHRAVPSGRSHVLGNIDVDGNTEMACLSHVSRRMRNWCTPWREGGALSSRGPRLRSEFLHFRVLMWEPAHIINGHVPRPVKTQEFQAHENVPP